MARLRRTGGRKITKENKQEGGNVLVSFSKRQSSLFSKANEFSILCGPHMALLLFSPGGKVYSYGHPNVEPVLDRFLTGNPPQQGEFDKSYEVNSNQERLNEQLTELKTMIKAEKLRAKANDEVRKENGSHHWWERPVEELDLQQLKELRGLMETVSKHLLKEA